MMLTIDIIKSVMEVMSINYPGNYDEHSHDDEWCQYHEEDDEHLPDINDDNHYDDDDDWGC